MQKLKRSHLSGRSPMRHLGDRVNTLLASERGSHATFEAIRDVRGQSWNTPLGASAVSLCISAFMWPVILPRVAPATSLPSPRVNRVVQPQRRLLLSITSMPAALPRWAMPSVYWAYNTGDGYAVTNSSTASLDGTLLTFVRPMALVRNWWF